MAKSRKTKKPAPAKTRSRSKRRPQKSPVVAPQRKRYPDIRAFRSSVIGAMALFGLIFAVGLAVNIHTLGQTTPPLSPVAIHDSRTYQQFRIISQQASNLKQQESTAETQVVSDAQLDQPLTRIQVDIQVGRNNQAQTLISQLQNLIDSARIQLAEATASSPAALAPTGPGLNLPILIYHYPPPDFNAQLDQLQQKGYTTVTMGQLADALHQTSRPLPPKPVVITFDDGFANQMTAYAELKQHHMVATFYIISGGARSKWCIGAGRRNHDALQPSGGCGDSYLTWDQIKQLDKSGIITIGAHTVDHESLPTDPLSVQQFEILANKRDIESHLGHAVDTFAYPYGTYDATTIAVVKAAGFTTAVTTTPGTTQTLAGIYTLPRVREIAQLP